MFAGLDMPASSAKTQADLGWKPIGIGLIADIGPLENVRFGSNAAIAFMCYPSAVGKEVSWHRVHPTIRRKDFCVSANSEPGPKKGPSGKPKRPRSVEPPEAKECPHPLMIIQSQVSRMPTRVLSLMGVSALAHDTRARRDRRLRRSLADSRLVSTRLELKYRDVVRG